MSGRRANLIMISEEHLNNDEILNQNVYGHWESVVLKGTSNAHYILFL